MTTVVERSVDILRTILETGRPSPAEQRTMEQLARRDHGSNPVQR